MIIGIDFDGTCVLHKFPEVGRDIGAAAVIRELVDYEHHIILFTMRSNNKARNYLDEAVKWFEDNNTAAFTAHITICIRITELASPLRRQYASFGISDKRLHI